MGLFLKSNLPAVDQTLSALILPRSDQARKQFARVQDAELQTIGGTEEIRLIGVDLDR